MSQVEQSQKKVPVKELRDKLKKDARKAASDNIARFEKLTRLQIEQLQRGELDINVLPVPPKKVRKPKSASTQQQSQDTESESLSEDEEERLPPPQPKLKRSKSIPITTPTPTPEEPPKSILRKSKK